MLRVFMRMLFGLCRRSCGIRRSNNIRPKQAGAIAGEAAEFGGSPTSRKICNIEDEFDEGLIQELPDLVDR